MIHLIVSGTVLLLEWSQFLGHVFGNWQLLLLLLVKAIRHMLMVSLLITHLLTRPHLTLKLLLLLPTVSFVILAIILHSYIIALLIELIIA